MIDLDAALDRLVENYADEFDAWCDEEGYTNEELNRLSPSALRSVYQQFEDSLFG